MPLLAIILAVVASIALGMLWYSSLMFGPMWMRLIGVNPDAPRDSSKMKGMWKSYTGNILLTIVTVFVVYALLGTGLMMTDIFAIWSAFALPVFANDVFYGGKPLKYFLIQAGYSIVSLAIVVQIILWVA